MFFIFFFPYCLSLHEFFTLVVIQLGNLVENARKGRERFQDVFFPSFVLSVTTDRIISEEEVINNV